MAAEWWRPERLAARRPYLMARARIVAEVRAFFAEQDFVEVETPGLQVSPGIEPHLMAFRADLDAPGEARQPRYLHTSPEFAMKKLLVAGEPRIFQIAHVWRNGERSATHHPEFSMLEWYRAGADYRDLMEDCEVLLRRCLRAVGREMFHGKNVASDPVPPFERLSVPEAFRDRCGIDLLATTPDPLKPDLALLAKASAHLGIAPHEGDEWEDLFFRILLDRIEPDLGKGRPTFLYDYPVSMAALSRPKPEDPRLAERFELYVSGIELANAFGELTDPKAQRARFQLDQEKKRQIYGETYPIDEDFLAALEYGMPASAGIALGLDRLVMVATGAPDIEDVLWAPVR